MGRSKLPSPFFFVHHFPRPFTMFNMATENDPFVDDLPMKNFGNSHHCCNLDDFAMILPWFTYHFHGSSHGKVSPDSPQDLEEADAGLPRPCPSDPGRFWSSRVLGTHRLTSGFGSVLGQRRDLKRRPWRQLTTWWSHKYFSFSCPHSDNFPGG
jgi:hypothetical protein